MNQILWLLAGAFFSSMAFIAYLLRYRRNVKKRALELTEFLESAVNGKESALSPKEDNLSLLEDEIYKTVGELRTAKEHLQKERIRQADNLADIAHQLKTPITSMSLMTQLLADSAVPSQEEYISRLDSQILRLEHLTSALLTMSRLDAGVVSWQSTSIAFKELLARAQEPLEGNLLERCQNLLLDGGDTLLNCDPAWTAEALLNILKNCSEHSPENSNITASCIRTALYTQITIEDNGCGFTPEETPKLFQRFYKGNNSSKESIGIGLSLSRSILKGQDGIIRAENRSEGGARFVIKLYGQHEKPM